MMKIKVRRVKVSDIRQLQEKLFDFYEIQKKIGCRDINKDSNVLWGGIAIELGVGFNNPNWYCVVADKDGELIALMIGVLEFCSPIAEDLKCVRIRANFLDEDSLIGPKILSKMWGMLNNWAKDMGAGHFYANIHPGNQPSVRTAKRIGFKHHYTQFYRPVVLDETEE
jgi:hypothetical protein